MENRRPSNRSDNRRDLLRASENIEDAKVYIIRIINVYFSGIRMLEDAKTEVPAAYYINVTILQKCFDNLVQIQATLLAARDEF